MKAVVFHKPKDMQVDQVEDPRIEDGRDVILRVTSTAICGSDLHIYNGIFPQAKPLTLGHEFMGVVEEAGSEAKWKVGERLVVPFPIACGHCWFCERAMPVHCERSNPKHYGPEGETLAQKGGGLFGYTDLYGGYSGGQAEYVRVPFADFGCRKVPDELADEQVLFLTDIFPTGWFATDLPEIKGKTVAVFGCGPVGIMAQKCAWLRGAERVIGVDVLDYRLEAARRCANSETINGKEQDATEVIRGLTDGRGADICIDAVGVEADRNFLDKALAAIHMERGTIKALKECLSAVRRGGTVSVVGVYGTPYDNFPLGQIFDKGLKLHMGQAPVHRYIDDLIELVRSQKIVLDDVISHRLPLSEAPRAYEIFNRKEEDCVKVVLHP